MTARLFTIAALVLGLLYVFATPPFMVPDEQGHVWRAFALAQGDLLVPHGPVPKTVSIEDRVGVLFWHLDDTMNRTGKYGLDELKVVWQLIPDGRRQNVKYAAIYTPAPYVPQALSVVMTTALNMRPVTMFYAGRVANLIASVLVVALAMRIAPQCSMIFAAIALMPMTLFEFGSWSADALTIAVAFVVIALVVRANVDPTPVTRSWIVAVLATVVFLSLCKPAYFLLTAFVATVPAARFGSSRRRWGVLIPVFLSSLAATAVSMAYFKRGFFNMRPLLPVDPDSQMACVINDPLGFAGVFLNEIVRNVRFYFEGIVGRFGMYDVKLPAVVIILGLVTLALVAITSEVKPSARVRIVATIIFIVISAGIIASQYLMWSPICGDTIEGVQGRYFLPVLPLLLIAISGLVRLRQRPALLVGIAGALNIAGVITQFTTYWI